MCPHMSCACGGKKTALGVTPYVPSTLCACVFEAESIIDLQHHQAVQQTWICQSLPPISLLELQLHNAMPGFLYGL